MATVNSTSSGNSVTSIYNAAVNDALLDPIQGFDAEVWVLDQSTGNQALLGRFTSIQITIRNATEPYLELNQRIPRYLDGEIQIGWVLERGLLDARILEQSFGFSALSRELRISRSPRFQITFELKNTELQRAQATDVYGAYVIDNGELKVQDGTTDLNNSIPLGKRQANGQLLLTFCKVDSFTMATTAGRNVIANRWEGLAEGIEQVNRNNVWSGTQLSGVANALQSLQKTFDQGKSLTNAGVPPGVTVVSTNTTNAANDASNNLQNNAGQIFTNLNNTYRYATGVTLS